MTLTIVYVLVFASLLAYAFLLMKYIRHWKSTPDFVFGKNTSDIFLTVVVPFFNEEKNIERLVGSFSSQELSEEKFEVLFIDDGSTDRSAEMIRSLCEKKFHFRIVNNRGQGKKQALRTGIENSKGELIVTTDADCTFPPGRLLSIVSFYEIEKPDMIILPVMMTGGKKFWQQFQATDFLALQLVGAGSALAGDPVLANGANLAFRKFDEDADLKEKYVSGEDIFLLEWMKQNGKKIKYLKLKDAAVKTQGPETVKQFLSQRARWISKAGGYSDTSLIRNSLMFLGINLIPLLLLFAGIFNPLYFVVLGLFLFVKTVTDYSLISLGFEFFETKVSFSGFVLMVAAYPFYMLTVIVKGFLLKGKWKH